MLKQYSNRQHKSKAAQADSLAVVCAAVAQTHADEHHMQMDCQQFQTSLVPNRMHAHDCQQIQTTFTVLTYKRKMTNRSTMVTMQNKIGKT